jgi:hypothetical protein
MTQDLKKFLKNNMADKEIAEMNFNNKSMLPFKERVSLIFLTAA